MFASLKSRQQTYHVKWQEPVFLVGNSRVEVLWDKEHVLRWNGESFGKGGLDGPDATGVELVSGWIHLSRLLSFAENTHLQPGKNISERWMLCGSQALE